MFTRCPRWLVPILASAAAGCHSDPTGGPSTTTGGPQGVAVLGAGSHDPASVAIEAILGPDDGLDDPTDVAFHPLHTAELWIPLRADDAIVIAFQAPSGDPTPSFRYDPTGNHFLARPSAIAFNEDDGTFASIHEEDNFTQGEPPQGTPADFMGPTLWTGDSDIFEGGDLSHLDMLHNSPNGVGIAWEVDNVYWVVDGAHESLTRYDFVEPHELGGTDHSDAVIQRWLEGVFTYVPDVVSHAVYDPDLDVVYAVDSGGDRVLAVDPRSGKKGDLYGPVYDTPDQYKWDDADFTVAIDGEAAGLELPAGLALHDGLLFVSDNATSTLWAFDPATGEAVDSLPLDRAEGGLQGLTFDRDGNLWFADSEADEVVRITP